MRPAFLGLVAGILAAIALTRFMASLLFQVSAIDPLVFGLVGVVLMLVAAVACFHSARRALHLDPSDYSALRMSLTKAIKHEPPSICLSPAAQIAWLHRHRRPHLVVRHWRQYRHLQRGQRGPAQTAAVSQS